MKTEARQRKSDFGNSGRSGGGFHPGIFSVYLMHKKPDQGLNDELRIEAKLSSEEKLEQQKQDDIFNPAIYVLMNENGFKGIWDKMFHQEYSKFSFKQR